MDRLTGVDASYAEWYHWARANQRASKQKSHAAARAAIAASAAEAAAAANAALTGPNSADGTTLPDSRTQAYAEWYDWVVAELGQAGEVAHRTARDIVRRLERGWSAQNVMVAARAESGRSAPAGTVVTAPAVPAIDGAGHAASAPTEATRYLCAAAYLDRAVRNRILNELDTGHLALATSPGIDLVPVMKHALIARRRQFIRDLVLGILLVLSFALGIITLLIGLIVAWLVVTWEAVSEQRLLASQLTKSRFDGAAPAGTFGPDDEAALAYAAVAQKGNVSVYSGFSPFVGTGQELGGWSFAINIERPRIELGAPLTPVKFEVGELYESVTGRIKALGLDSVTIDDRLFVNGAEIREDGRFMPDPLGRPVTSVRPEIVAQFVNNGSRSIRHYKRIAASSWNSEMVLTMFLRFRRTDRTLFAEAAYQLLTPLKESHHRVDSLPKRQSARHYFNAATESALRTPGVWIASPFRALAALGRPVRRWLLERATRRMILENAVFDYGARDSIRDYSSSRIYQRYFQKLDKEMYLKVIERHMLDAIIEFLDRRNIDTTDLRQQQTTIQNSGVMVSGGTLHAENVAVGAGANIAGRLTQMVNAARGQGGS